MMYLNYPNNPTTAVADKNFLKEAVDFASEHEIIVCYDNAYSEITFDGYKAPSILEIDGAIDVSIEFNSLSKIYNMTGWRCGWACGNDRIINGLRMVKSQIDSGLFSAIERTGVAALTGPQDCVAENLRIYKERRSLLVGALKSLGLAVTPPKGTFYVWCPCPEGVSSAEFTKYLLDKAGILVTPGNGFGDYGEGFVRFSLTVPTQRIEKAVERLRNLKI